MRLLHALAFAAMAFAVDAISAPTVTVTNVPTARSSIRIAHMRPDVPVANLLVLTGGNGVFNLSPNQGIPTTGIFREWLDRGSSVILVDAPSDMLAAGMTFPYRASAEHAAELAAVLRAVQQRDNLPAWVLGWSAGSVSVVNFALRTPLSTPFGIILQSPATSVVSPNILELNLDAMQRPTLLLTHASDTCQGTPPTNAPTVMSRLSATPARRHREFTGGNAGVGCDANGPHGFGGLEVPFAQEVTQWQLENATHVQAANYQGLWWRSPAGSESGWGVNITHQGEVLFMTWFTYDTDGTGMWLVMSGGTRTGEGIYSGALYRTTGPAFNATPFTPAQVVTTEVGSATFTFTDSNNGTFQYTVNGVTQTRPITRFVYASPVPGCIAGASHLASPNYQAIWWAAPDFSESGWGVNLTHQGDVLFATWFTYGTDGRGMWLVMSEGVRTAPGTYSGDLYRTTGPAFSASPWNGPAVATRVGSATFTFTGAEAGTFAYTVGTVSQTKTIKRYGYASPVTVCR